LRLARLGQAGRSDEFDDDDIGRSHCGVQGVAGVVGSPGGQVCAQLGGQFGDVSADCGAYWVKG